MKNQKSICVLGLGYIGLPTASMFATNGHKVHGVDVNPRVVETLKAGRIHIEEPGLQTVVKAAISSENLFIDNKVAPSDVFIITVPTPHKISNEGKPLADMSYVEAALNSLIPHLKPGNLVILESTSPPGTTRDLVIPALEKAGFKPGVDVGVAYCPERVIPGKALIELVGNDRVVGGINEKWAKETQELYQSFVSGNIFLTDPTTAEMVKILENTYRDVNIALANEVALLCEKIKINVWDVVRLTNRHPRVNVHQPGPGVGGHCISVDPWFLVEKFQSETDIIPLARAINDRMPNHVVSMIERLIGDKKKAKVAALGLAYKGNVDDTRESPAISVLKTLKKLKPEWEISVHDPHANHQDFSNEPLRDALKNADLAVILSAHDEFKQLNPDEIGPLMAQKLIYDTHNILTAERWIPAGFQLKTLGDGKNPDPSPARARPPVK